MEMGPSRRDFCLESAPRLEWIPERRLGKQGRPRRRLNFASDSAGKLAPCQFHLLGLSRLNLAVSPGGSKYSLSTEKSIRISTRKSAFSGALIVYATMSLSTS